MSLLNSIMGGGGNGGGGGGKNGSGGGSSGNGVVLGMSMDIWSTGAFSFESPLKDLLDSGDYTLEQLLAEDELLQELRGLHPMLMQYFSTERNLTKLLLYVTQQPNKPASSMTDRDGESLEKHDGAHHAQTPVNGNRETPSSSSPQGSAVKTETMTNDDGGVEAVAASSSSALPVATAITEGVAKAEPGVKWLLAQLEKKPSMDNNSITIVHDEGDALKKKHPELDPEMLYIRFPFMACEIIC